ncbi:hypothetical protein IQ06DRAFT_146 [Phaeosphaeriaceae sp. SRC1lsM3a]|nr:hypothetical protein IQ06DRAFT_146 [Stagonospora sp. SRC1lsM3a]
MTTCRTAWAASLRCCPSTLLLLFQHVIALPLPSASDPLRLPQSVACPLSLHIRPFLQKRHLLFDCRARIVIAPLLRSHSSSNRTWFQDDKSHP